MPSLDPRKLAIQQAVKVLTKYVKTNPNLRLGKVKDIVKELKEYPTDTLRTIIKDFSEKPKIVSSINKIKKVVTNKKPNLKVIKKDTKKYGGKIIKRKNSGPIKPRGVGAAIKGFKMKGKKKCK